MELKGHDYNDNIKNIGMTNLLSGNGEGKMQWKGINFSSVGGHPKAKYTLDEPSKGRWQIVQRLILNPINNVKCW